VGFARLIRYVALGFGVALLAVLHASRVDAQTAPATTSVSLDPIVTHSHARTGFLLNSQLNYADCEDDDILTFSLTLQNRQTYPLEVWAGDGCDELAVRTSTTQTKCWLLYSATPAVSDVSVDIHARSIVWGTTTGYPGMAGSTAIVPGTLIDAGQDACEAPGSAAPVGPTPIELYFMLVDPSNLNSIVGTSATWTASAKLVGPPPPDTLTAAIGDRELVLHFSYDNDQESDPTINGYQFYCDPQPGLAAAADAGVAPTDAGVAAQACGVVPSQVLIPAAPHLNLPLPCGTAPLTATGGTVTGLVNGVPYDVATAAVDTYENVGPLSRLACDVPVPSNSRQDVRACSFSPGRPKAPIFLLGALVACCWLRRRRGC
jgi:hypothetical protein